MKFEVDYRDDYGDVEDVSADTSIVSGEPVIETFIQEFDEITEVYRSQFAKINSLRKVDMIKDVYDKLKDVAQQSCGYASLEIDEADESVSMEFRCEYFFVSNSDEGSKDVVAEILCLLVTSFQSITFTAENEEVVIRVKDFLYEEIKTTDKSKEIEQIRNSMK